MALPPNAERAISPAEAGQGLAETPDAGAAMSIERAFCRNREHLPSFKAYGLPDKLIYLDGRGGEDLDRCLASFRGRPGRLLVAPDLRVFGASKKAVAQTMARLERAKIRVVDVIHPQDETVSEQLHRASVLISGTRFRDRRTARNRGREGGVAKGEIARSTRAQIDTDRLIRNVVREHARIGWPIVLRICGGKLSESTLRRHYLFRRAPKKNERRK